MVQTTTTLDVADNSGAKKIMCIRVLGGTKLVIDAPNEGEHVEVQGPSGVLTERVAQALGAVAVAK